MSNHRGSYMLADVLALCKENAVFDTLGKKKTQDLVIQIVKLSDEYDCNPCEILENLGATLGICCICLKSTNELERHFCKTCYQEHFG